MDLKEKLLKTISSKNQQYMLLIIVLVAVTLYMLMVRAEASYSLDFGDTSMTISASDEMGSIVIPYEDVQYIELLDTYEVGTMISGKSDRLLYYGVFQNELYGEYLLCVRPSVENAIRINMEDQVVIFNYESEEVTAELCDTMEDFIAEKLTEEQVK